MKKFLLLAALVMFSLSNVNAQGEFNAGIFGGIPMGDAGDFASFTLGIDLEYLFDVSDTFAAGPTVGYSTTFLKSEFEGDNIAFLPVAAAGRFAVSDEFTLGVDLGYAVGINDGNEGGLYFAPKLQYGISEAIDVGVSYRSVSEEHGSFNFFAINILLHLAALAATN